MSNEKGASRIDRRMARSGNVSYSDPVPLHESSKSRVVLVPFFIAHTDRNELAVKLVTSRKANPPESWYEVEEKSLSLQESATRKLFKALREHLAVAEEGTDGSYILLPIHEGSAQIGEHDPEEVAVALIRALGRTDIRQHLSGLDLSAELATALRGAIRLSEMRSAVERLRLLLNEGQVAEEAYQRWCTEHTWAFGNAYVMRDEVREISPGDKLDILLPTVISGHRDIVELKRPDMTVLNYDSTHRNYYFSSEVSKAIGQTHRYLDVLHEVASKGLRDHPEIVAYHPRAIVVIGRSHDWPIEQLTALHGLNRRLNGIAVMTYDQLLAQGERLIEMVSVEGEEDDDEPSLQQLADDDFPF